MREEKRKKKETKNGKSKSKKSIKEKSKKSRQEKNQKSNQTKKFKTIDQSNSIIVSLHHNLISAEMPQRYN